MKCIPEKDWMASGFASCLSENFLEPSDRVSISLAERLKAELCTNLLEQVSFLYCFTE